MPTLQGGTAVATDRITVNKMVLAKIGIKDWEDNMKICHHTLPNQQIAALKESVQITKDGRGRDVAYPVRIRAGCGRWVYRASAVTGGVQAPSFAGVA